MALKRPLRAAAVAALLALSAWIAAGIRVIDPEKQFAIVERRLVPGPPRVLTGRRLVLAPPGAFRATLYPVRPEVLPLPDARTAFLPSADGSRYGLKGTATVAARPDRGEALVASAGGSGLSGVLLGAVRAAAVVFSDADREDRGISTRTNAFERRLGEELAARGALLTSLDLAGFDDLTAATSTRPIPPDVKVLVVGLDGADWKIADPLMAAGRMPNLKSLVDGGVRSNLLSITPMLSPVIWTSMATGVEPARHGILDFLAPTASGGSEPVASTARRVPAVWELLSQAGAPVGVTGWWATWPADPVKGYMITDRVAYQLFGYSSDPRSAAGKAWPASVYDVVRPLIVPTDAIPWSDLTRYLTGTRQRPEEFNADERERLDEFRTLLAAGKTYLDVALAMRERVPVKFESVYFEGTDTVGHLFMSFRPPRLPSADPESFNSFQAIVDRYYEEADRMLGRLLEGREDWTVIVVSDHGFAADQTRPLTTDSRIGHGAAADWHRRFGVFVMRGPGVKKGVHLDEASIYDIAPTILALFHQPVPRSWPGRVLAGALEPDLLGSHPVLFRDDDPVRQASGEPQPDNAEESRELREKLQSLGYLGTSDTQLMTTKNNRGVGLLAEGKFTEAAGFFRQALADQPDQPTLMVNLGIALRFAGERKEAAALFEKAYHLPNGRRAAAHQLAQLQLEDGDLAGAEARLRSILERDPGADEVHTSLGVVLERQGRPKDAAAEYVEAARLDANAAEPRNNLGNLVRKERRLDEAERWYLAAIAADPYFAGAYNNLALLCQDRGQIDRAIDLYGRALAKAPKNAVVMNNLASLYFATGSGREARALWRRAVETDPKYSSPLNNLAGLALSEGDYAGAAELLDRALEVDPGYGDARINRSLLYRQRGDAPAARRELEEAAKDPRARGTALVQLALLDLESGDPRLAVTGLEAARRELGDRPDVLNALGEGYARLGEIPKAVAVLRRSLAIDGSQEGIRGALNKLEKQ